MTVKSPFFLFLFLIYSFVGFSQPDAASKAIQDLMNEYPVAGLSVAVVKDGKMIYKEAFGYKHIETKEPLTTEALFRIASISKSFTATGIMQLVEKKKLHLDDDVSKLIGFTVRNPHFPDKVITLRMLLSHTSSINDSEGYFTLDAIDPAKNPNWQKAYNTYEPGTDYEYCNLNFNMAGTILETYSGERFDKYIENHILTPLGLTGSHNVNSLDSNSFATIYDYNSKTKEFVAAPAAYASRKKDIENYIMGKSTPVFSPTGGLKISAPDLATYMMMHMKGGKQGGKRILSKKSERIMRTPLSHKGNYGLALLTTKKLIPGETMIGHTGSAYGLFSAMFFEPEKKFGIVVISNGCAPGHTDGYNTVIAKAVNALYDALIKK